VRPGLHQLSLRSSDHHMMRVHFACRRIWWPQERPLPTELTAGSCAPSWHVFACRFRHKQSPSERNLFGFLSRQNFHAPPPVSPTNKCLRPSTEAPCGRELRSNLRLVSSAYPLPQVFVRPGLHQLSLRSSDHHMMRVHFACRRIWWPQEPATG